MTYLDRFKVAVCAMLIPAAGAASAIAQETLKPDVKGDPANVYNAGRSVNSEVCGAVHIITRPVELDIRLTDASAICRESRWRNYIWLREGTHRVMVCAPDMNPAIFDVITVPGYALEIDVAMEPGSLCSQAGTLDEFPVDLGGVNAEPQDDLALSVDESKKRLRRRPMSDGLEMTRTANTTCLKIRVVPADSEVYLDGKLLELGEPSASDCVYVLAGRHKLKVTRQSYKTWTRKLRLGRGSMRIEVELEKMSP